MTSNARQQSLCGMRYVQHIKTFQMLHVHTWTLTYAFVARTRPFVAPRGVISRFYKQSPVLCFFRYILCKKVVFDKFDRSHAGHITGRDLREFLGRELDDSDIDNMLREAGVRHGGRYVVVDDQLV